MKSYSLHHGGYTIIEIMTALAISGVLFAAFMSAFITLQDSFSASYNYALNTNDQERVVDYITRDVRRALTKPTISGSGTSQILQVTIPDYYGSYDVQGNPAGPIIPPVLTGGTLTYSGSLTVVYSLVSGSSLLRQQTNTNGAGATVSSTLILGTGVSTFQLENFQNDPGLLNFTVGFAPQYSFCNSPRLSATVSATVAMRHVTQ